LRRASCGGAANNHPERGQPKSLYPERAFAQPAAEMTAARRCRRIDRRNWSHVSGFARTIAAAPTHLRATERREGPRRSVVVSLWLATAVIHPGPLNRTQCQARRAARFPSPAGPAFTRSHGTTEVADRRATGTAWTGEFLYCRRGGGLECVRLVLSRLFGLVQGEHCVALTVRPPRRSTRLEALTIRPQRHVPNSITTIRRERAGAIANRLQRCPRRVRRIRSSQSWNL
jgi:hypothetical protein